MVMYDLKDERCCVDYLSYNFNVAPLISKYNNYLDWISFHHKRLEITQLLLCLFSLPKSTSCYACPKPKLFML